MSELSLWRSNIWPGHPSNSSPDLRSPQIAGSYASRSNIVVIWASSLLLIYLAPTSYFGCWFFEQSQSHNFLTGIRRRKYTTHPLWPQYLGHNDQISAAPLPNRPDLKRPLVRHPPWPLRVTRDILTLTDLFVQALFLKYLAALLAVFNPLFGIPVFLAMTEGFTSAERRRTALIVALSSTIFAMVCVLVGEEILAIFGINVPSFRIAGGFILIGIGFRMLNTESRSAGDTLAIEEGKKKTGKGISVVPLAIPLTIGPGALAVTIVFAHQLSDAAEIVTLTPVVLIACLISGLGLVFADPLSRFLGLTTINIATRIMAIVLIAISVEMVVTGALDAIDDRYPHLASDIGET
jgi:MarC family membrane protein